MMKKNMVKSYIASAKNNRSNEERQICIVDPWLSSQHNNLRYLLVLDLLLEGHSFHSSNRNHLYTQSRGGIYVR
jgi:hypothetical protein